MTNITRPMIVAAIALLAAGSAAAQATVQPVTVRAVAHFDFDRSVVLPTDQQAMLAEVGKMQGVTWQKVTAVGHADAIGSAEYNDGLSARRAQAVKAFLVGKGLDPAMIGTAAKGSSAPVASNDSSSGRAQNRRTEIEFQGVRTAAAK